MGAYSIAFLINPHEAGIIQPGRPIVVGVHEVALSSSFGIQPTSVTPAPI